MSRKFDYAVEHVLWLEGVESDDVDAGGVTRYGITRPVLAELGAIEGDLDGNGVIDAADVRLLSRSQAIDIYRRFWWERFGYEAIAEEGVAARILALSVNAGGMQAHKIVQRTINALIQEWYKQTHEWIVPLAVDGIFGGRTAAAVNEITPSFFLHEFRAQMEVFYRACVARNPNYKPYLDGWLNRAAY